MNRKCFRESTLRAPKGPQGGPFCPAFLIICRVRPGVPRKSRGHLLHLGQALVAVGFFLCFCPFFWCYRVAQRQGALVILSAPNPICCATLGKSLPFSGPYFPLL